MLLMLMLVTMVTMVMLMVLVTTMMRMMVRTFSSSPVSLPLFGTRSFTKAVREAQASDRLKYAACSRLQVSGEGRPPREEFSRDAIRAAAAALGLPTREPGSGKTWKSRVALIEACAEAWRTAHPDEATGIATGHAHGGESQAATDDAPSGHGAEPSALASAPVDPSGHAQAATTTHHLRLAECSGEVTGGGPSGAVVTCTPSFP